MRPACLDLGRRMATGAPCTVHDEYRLALRPGSRLMVMATRFATRQITALVRHHQPAGSLRREFCSTSGSKGSVAESEVIWKRGAQPSPKPYTSCHLHFEDSTRSSPPRSRTQWHKVQALCLATPPQTNRRACGFHSVGTVFN